MNARYLAALCLAVGGCSPSATRSASTASFRDEINKNDASQLPKLKIDKILDGYLIQLGSHGELVTAKPPGGQYASNRDNYGSQFDYLVQHPYHSTTAMQLIPTTGSVTNFSENDYIDPEGKIRPYIDETPVEIEEAGRPVGLLPMMIRSARYRFYRSADAIFFRGIDKKDIVRATDHFDRQTQLAVVNDQITILAKLPDGVWKFSIQSIGGMPQELYRGDRPLKVTQGPHNELLVVSQFGSFLQDEKKHSVRLNFSVWGTEFYSIGGKTYVVGGATRRLADENWTDSVASMWNPLGQPVPLGILCPTLQAEIQKLNYKSISYRLTANESGTLVYQVSGEIEVPRTDFPGMSPSIQNVSTIFVISPAKP